MPTPAKPEGPQTMEQSMGEFGSLLRKLRTDVTGLVQGDGAKFQEVILDASQLAGGIQEFILSLGSAPLMGNAQDLAACKGECMTECQQIESLVAEHKPRFATAGAGGSQTEGAKIDNLLALVEKLMPLIKLFFLT